MIYGKMSWWFQDVPSISRIFIVPRMGWCLAPALSNFLEFHGVASGNPLARKNGIAHSKWPKLRGNPSQWKVNKGDRHLIDISLSSVSYFYAQVGLASLVNLKSIENCLNVFFNVSRFSMWCIIKYHQIASNIIIMSWNIQFQPFFSETRAKAGALQRTSIGKPRLLWWQPGNQGRQNDATQCFSGRLKSVQSYINLLAEFITWYNYLQLYDLK